MNYLFTQVPENYPFKALPFAPESEEEMMKRFPAAISEPITVDRMKLGVEGKVIPVTLNRKHVFDFSDGLRMCATHEHLQDGNHYHHLSFGMDPDHLQFKVSLPVLIGKADAIAKKFLNREDAKFRKMSSRAFHLWFLL